MRIYVTAKPSSKHEKIEQIDATHYAISVKEPPSEGKANKAIIKALAEHFAVPKSFVIIVSGQLNKQKVIEVVL
ncbi:MAG: DUF167 domain-containing protein [Candidatus Levybacteria bacterium]|nr:DUF167 domain-containing protein [Candidatus Levybacteria bacterium]